MQPIRVGDLIVQPVLDGTATLETNMFTVGDAETDWENHKHLLDEQGKLNVPVGAFVVRTSNEVVLLDAGVGDVHDEMFDGGRLIDNLLTVGVRTEDVTIVMVSHLHSDHCGWLETNGKPTFANAVIRIGAGDWEHFVTKELGGKKRADRLRSVQDHVDLIDADATTIAPGLTTRATPGHTPGHTSTVISSGTERLIVMGDALHCPAQLTETEWQFFFDVDKGLASRTRESLLREADDPNTTLLPMHFPGMTAGRLVQAAGKRQWIVG